MAYARQPIPAYRSVLDAVIQLTPRGRDNSYSYNSYIPDAFIITNERTDEHKVVALGDCWETRNIDAGVVEVLKATPNTKYVRMLFGQKMDVTPQPIDIKNWIHCNEDDQYKEITSLLKIMIPMMAGKLKPLAHQKVL